MKQTNDFHAHLSTLLEVALSAIRAAARPVSWPEGRFAARARGSEAPRLADGVVLLQLERHGSFNSASLCAPLRAGAESPMHDFGQGFVVDMQTVAMGMIAQLRRDRAVGSTELYSGHAPMVRHEYEEHDGCFDRPGATVTPLDGADLYLAVSSGNSPVWDAQMVEIGAAAIQNLLAEVLNKSA